MARTLGIVTIGQAPRDDIADLFAAHAPAGTKVILRGALDGLSDSEVDRLQPENGGDTLYTRLRGGRDVKISKKAVIARSPAALDKLRGDGCDVLVYACTGEFPPMPGDENVLFPSRVLNGLATGLLPRDGPRAAGDARLITTQCCIVGGGPAGMMLGFLLARAGVKAVVLEKHGDFLRDFRGDTVH